MTEMTTHLQQKPQTALKMGWGLLLSACLMSAGAQTKTPEVPKPAQTSASISAQAAPVSQAWQQLTPQQKQALAPLGAQWGALTAQQQSKWIAISQNFAQLSVTEQITMHARMTDWVALSPQQRTLARLNFNKLQNLPKEDKKAKWEAYQALSSEEKRLLSAGSATPIKSAAPTAKPLEAHRVVQTPAKAAGSENRAPGTEINRKTLLPRPPALAAPATMTPAPATDTTRQATETAPS
ncbi:hypothetical protein B9Z37_02185 [Limnohabitans parvus II-B4]|uniref:DUF3106 domain-containing protein n=2 Tax=Limnohabitans TaxID=665874 RepID=A0A315EE47_9BURK|nr:hypothetical protein B9Z37_02185 [Limnohabitans parvus II-B4]